MGLLPTTYYYTPKVNEGAMHRYSPLHGAFFNREFPASWRDIDKSIGNLPLLLPWYVANRSINITPDRRCCDHSLFCLTIIPCLCALFSTFLRLYHPHRGDFHVMILGYNFLSQNNIETIYFTQRLPGPFSWQNQ